MDTQITDKKELLKAAVTELGSRFGNNTATTDAPTVTEPPRIARPVREPETEARVPQTQAQIERDLTRAAKTEITALNTYYNTERADQKRVNEERSRGTSSVNTLTGLAGSTEANKTTNETNSVNKEALKKVEAERTAAIQQVLGNVKQAAVEEARAQREEYRLDTAAVEERRAAAKTEAITSAATLAGAGVTIDGYAASDPEGYQYLADKVGGSEVLKAMFTLNRPAETILDKKIEGGKYIIAYQNPLDGSTRVETFDLGLPTGYSKTIDAGNRILAVPDNWSGDPSELITINKGLTPGQALDAAGGGGGNQGTFENDLDALVSNVYNIIPSKNGKEAFENSIKRARDDADIINTIATVALRNSPGEVRNDFIKQAQGVRSLDKAIEELDKGVETGVFQTGTQYVYNIFGKDYDPGLQKISANITAAIQPYRSSVTGAAWGDQEDAEYANMFGSTRYSPEELRQRLVNVKAILMDKSTTALTTQVSPFGSDPIFGYQNSGNDFAAEVEAAGYDYAAMQADGLSDTEIREAISNR